MGRMKEKAALAGMFDEVTASPGKTDTSAEAAEKIQPALSGLLLKAYSLLCRNPDGVTGDEFVRHIGGAHVDYSIRPRLSDLVRLGYARKMDKDERGGRRKNQRGNNEIVYKVLY